MIVVQLLTHVSLFRTPRTVAHQAPLPSTTPRVCSNSGPLSQWCYLTISSSPWQPPSPFAFSLSRISLFHGKDWLLLPLCNRSPKYWSFSFSPSNAYSGLMFFTIDWFNLLAIQGTLKSLLQHNWKAINSSELIIIPGKWFNLSGSQFLHLENGYQQSGPVSQGAVEIQGKHLCEEFRTQSGPQEVFTFSVRTADLRNG